MNLTIGGEGGKIVGFDYMKFSKMGNSVFINKLKTDEKFRAYYIELSRQKSINNYKNGACKNFKCDCTGKKHKKETIKKMKLNMKGKHLGNLNSQYGTKWIYNPDLKKNKKILKTDLIPNGWINGRKMKFN